MFKQAFHNFRHSEDGLARVLRNSAWLFTGKGVAAVLSFFYLAILTRTLGAEGFGQFALIFSSVQIIAVLLRFQTWHSIVRYGAQYLLKSDHASYSALSLVGIIVEIAGALTGCVLAWLLIPVIGEYFGWTVDFIELTRGFAIAVLLSIRSTAMGILRGHDRFRDSALADAMIPIGRMVGALVVLFSVPSVGHFLFAWAGAEVLCTLVFWLLVWRNTPLHRGGFSIAVMRRVMAEAKGITRFMLTTNLFEQIAILREHLVVIGIGFLLGAKPAGLFRLANQLANALARLADIFARPLFTELARLHASEDHGSLSQLFFRSLRISTYAGIAVIVLLILVGKPFLGLMAGPEFVAAYPLLVVMGAATGLGLIGLGLDPLLHAAGKAHISAAISFIALLVMLGAMVVAVPVYGAIGGAFAMLAAGLFTLVLLLYFSLREIRSG